eukprot:378351-Ditylum_brightwellii.AAC.1
MRLLRGINISQALYGFGDASKAGFGSSFSTHKGLQYCIGVWGHSLSQNSSNWCELRNLVDSLEDYGKAGHLKGTKLFLFTDSEVCENTFYRGSSTNWLLHDLILRLHKLESQYGCRIHLVHCAGTHMIAQGTDGLSQGSMVEGIINGDIIFSFIPTHLLATAVHPPLKDWIFTWVPRETEIICLSGWFERGHDIVGGTQSSEGLWHPTYASDIYVWDPPLATLAAAIEQLQKAYHKCQTSTHIVVIHKLFTPEWQHPLHKVADIVLDIPAGQLFWPESCHEPLILALYTSPSGNGKESVPHVERGMSTALDFPQVLPTNNDGVVFKQRADPDKSMVAREGDWLCAPFQCDFCWFQNLKQQDADPSSLSDLHLLDHIRQ